MCSRHGNDVQDQQACINLCCWDHWCGRSAAEPVIIGQNSWDWYRRASLEHHSHVLNTFPRREIWSKAFPEFNSDQTVKFFGFTITFSLLAKLFSSEIFLKFWENWLAIFPWQHSRGCQRFLPKFSCCQQIFPKIQNYDKRLLHIQDDTGKKKLSPDRSGNVMVNPENSILYLLE